MDPQAAIASAQSALAVASAAVQAAPAVATQGASVIPGVNQVLAVGGTAVAAGGAMEHLLEQFVMDKAPAWLKPLLPVAIAIGGGTWAGLQAGLPWPAAVAAGLTAYGTAVKLHDSTSLTASAPGA